MSSTTPSFKKLLDEQSAPVSNDPVGRATLLALCSLVNTNQLTFDLNCAPGQKPAQAEGTGMDANSLVTAGKGLHSFQMRHVEAGINVEVQTVRSGPEHITVIVSALESPTNGLVPVTLVLHCEGILEASPTTVIDMWTPQLNEMIQGKEAGASTSTTSGGGNSNNNAKDKGSSSGGFGDVKPGNFDDFQRSQAARHQEIQGYGEGDLRPGGGAPVGPGFAGEGGRGAMGIGGGNYAGPNSALFHPDGRAGTGLARGDPRVPGGLDPFSANPDPDHAPLMGPGGLRDPRMGGGRFGGPGGIGGGSGLGPRRGGGGGGFGNGGGMFM